MSKKKKKKFLKKKKKFKKVHQQKQQANIAPALTPKVEDEILVDDKKAEEDNISAKPDREDDPYNDPKYLYIKKDIKKILIIFGVIIALLLAVLFTNKNSQILNTMGNWVYKVLNINTQ